MEIPYLRFITVKDILSIFKHPLKAYKMLTGKPDYLNFVSKVTDKSERICRSYLPKGRSRQVLVYMSGGHALSAPIHWEQATALYLIIRILRPSYVVETGAGRSTIFMLQALEDIKQGHLYSIDINPKVASLIPRELASRWTFINGYSRDVLPILLYKIGKIDIFFHDSDHSYENMMFEFETVWTYLAEGGVLLSHDTDLNTAFEEFVKSKNVLPYFLGRKYRMGGIRKLQK